MLRKLRPRVTYANVVATLALFLALGGGAYAAATIGASNIRDDAVRSRHIKNAEVKNADLAASSVGTGKVIDGSLLKRDFKAGQLPKGGAGPGAISIPITHVDYATHGHIRTIDGINISYHCEGGPVEVDINAAKPGRTIYVSGEKAQDSVLSELNTSTAGAVDAFGSATTNLDVIATVNGTWNRIDLGGYSSGDVNGCNIWGLLIPGT